ncbi:hypothetical protein NIES37_45520 [Tolypothrix tenuis PCC 7101]|uniref:Uncharacterized protein n=1 Tax=Tolypothrix tenuis PCC 7101 TaxID=231146 RepID=A0A1Z4N4C8_9CYAN|nr:hypothetical protein NIES37_45520 [Tolypothrix tenuis PCC 7101]BAZ75522.1 hypothetical protein NIES50_41050 [Aulosira laxa NIES-50]
MSLLNDAFALANASYLLITNYELSYLHALYQFSKIQKQSKTQKPLLHMVFLILNFEF